MNLDFGTVVAIVIALAGCLTVMVLQLLTNRDLDRQRLYLMRSLSELEKQLELKSQKVTVKKTEKAKKLEKELPSKSQKEKAKAKKSVSKSPKA